MEEARSSHSRQSTGGRRGPGHNGRTTTTTASGGRSRHSNQAHQHGDRTDTNKDAEPSPEALLSDQVGATKKLISWAISDLTGTIDTFKSMRDIFRRRETKWDKDVKEMNILGPVNLTKKHWDFDAIIFQYKEEEKARIEHWKGAMVEVEARKAEWEANLEFLDSQEFKEALRSKATEKKTVFTPLWAAARGQTSPWDRYEQINNEIANYFGKTWEGEPVESDRHTKSLYGKILKYYTRSRGQLG